MRCYRKLRLPPGVFLPPATPTPLHPFHLSTEHAGRSAVLGVLLDRPRVRAGSDLARNPDDADDNNAKLGPG